MILPLNVFYRMDFWKKLGHINEVFPGVLYVQEGNRMENRGETYRKEEKWVCSVCGYVYDGDDFESEPDDYVCPVCGAKKDMFKLQ